MNSAGASSDTLSSTSDFDFLQFYRIYLVDSSGNDVEPKTVDGQKVNLQVTLDYSNVGIPAGWSSAVSKGVWVGHYSTDGTTKKDISSDGNSFGTGVKKVSVNSSKKTITFHVKDFSGVAIGTPAASSGSSDDATEVEAAQTGGTGDASLSWAEAELEQER